MKALNAEFSDIVTEGLIETTVATKAEIEDDDALDCDRIAFVFDRRQFGRLRQLVDRLNEVADLPETTSIPTPMSEEQAERPW